MCKLKEKKRRKSESSHTDGLVGNLIGLAGPEGHRVDGFLGAASRVRLRQWSVLFDTSEYISFHPAQAVV